LIRRLKHPKRAEKSPRPLAVSAEGLASVSPIWPERGAQGGEESSGRETPRLIQENGESGTHKYRREALIAAVSPHGKQGTVGWGRAASGGTAMATGVVHDCMR
jgi:hypothetical protein